MKKIFYEGRFVFIPIAAAAFLSLVSFVVMNLWNFLMPALFHLGMITFWQAMALFVLCKVLFGFGKGGRGMGNSHWMRGRMEERFKNMSPEERAKFKEQMESRMCGNRNRFGRHGFDRNWSDFEPETEKAAE